MTWSLTSTSRPATAGDLRARVAWADDAGASVDDTAATYPWALLTLLVAVLAAAIGWGWWRARGKARSDERRRRREQVDAYPLPDVVFVEDLGGFLVNPATQRGRRMLNAVAGRLSTADLNRLAAGRCVTSTDVPASTIGRERPGAPQDIPGLDGQRTLFDDMMNDISHT